MTSLPIYLQEDLERIASEFTGEYDQVVQNIRTIINLLVETYGLTSWEIQKMFISIWEDDCVVIQWTDTNLFCFVYPNFLSLDTTKRLLDDQFQHDEKELDFENSKELGELFVDTFSAVIPSVSFCTR